MTKDVTEQVFSMVDFTNCSNFWGKMKITSRYVAIKTQIPHATTIIIRFSVGSLNCSWVHPPEVASCSMDPPMDGSTERQGGKARQGHRWHRRQELRRSQATRRRGPGRVLRGQELPGSFRSSTEESAREPPNP